MADETTHPSLCGKTYLIVTGASQGIGRQISKSFSQFLKADSCVLLLARNKDALKDTASELPKHLKVYYETVDLSSATANDFEIILKKPLEAGSCHNFERFVIVHNAGSMGDITQASADMNDIDKWHKYYHLNVFSPAVLNSAFMKMLKQENNVQKLVINITSLFGIQPMKSFGYYCSGKAAREMFFKVFALENLEVDVLNYSPGPVQTEMLQLICDNAGNEEFRQEVRNMQETKKILTTEQTVDRLLTVLKEKKYKSGDHVDYFDDI